MADEVKKTSTHKPEDDNQFMGISKEEAAALEAKGMENLEKVDKEARTRKFTGPMAKVFYIICILVSCYHLYTALFGGPVTLVHRSMHVAMILTLAFMMYPGWSSASKKFPNILDWGLILVSWIPPVYLYSDYVNIVQRAGDPSQTDMYVATLLVFLVLEATRRVSGWCMPILSIIFIAYGIFGRSAPGAFMHRGYDWLNLSNHFFANTEGIYGTSVGVAASYIFLFILFGAVMTKSGMGKFFNDIAMACAGHTKGGPANVSVIASGFLGSINGSAVANVVTTGCFTIPLMKKTGYSADFAGAVESTASVGGQLLPPIMGAAAFIMAEMLGVKYSQIIVWAAIPALLYYTGILIQVQLRASKMGMKGRPKSELPSAIGVLKEQGHLLLPLIFLMYMLFFSGTTVIFSAVCTIAVVILSAALKKATRMSGKDVLDALADGAKATVGVAVACACVGIIIGVSSKTGFGLNMGNTIIELGNTSVLFTLLFTMVTCMILGMGLPSIPAYIITAAIAAPALSKLGIAPAAAHMFSFYFAMFANLTPPVALAAFAAAGISGGDPFKTGFTSVRLAIAGFIVPYMFVYSPQLMLIDCTLLEGAWVTVTALVGVFLIGVACEGYLYAEVNWLLRALALVGSLMLIKPGLETDIIGFVLIAGIIFLQKRKAKQNAAPVA